MNWTHVLSSPWPYLITGALAALVGWTVWKQPLRPGSRYFRWLVVIWFSWSLVAVLHNLVPIQPVRYVLWVMQAMCPLLGAPLVLMIALEYTGNEKWLAYRSLNLLFIPALLVVVLSFWPGAVSLSETHSGVPFFRAVELVRWGFYTYFVAVMLVTIGVLVACLLRAPAFWAPLCLLILGRLIPMIGYPFPNPAQLSVSPVQAGLLFLDFTMVLYFIALYSFQILRIRPVARDTVIARMPYSLLVLDAENRLVDFNAAAQSLPDVPGKLALREPVSTQLPGWWRILGPLVNAAPISQDVFYQDDAGEKVYRVTNLPLLQASGWRAGQAFLLEDVTQARRSEQRQAQTRQAMATLQERDRLARELHDELAQGLALINVKAQLVGALLGAGKTEQARAQLQLLAQEARRAHADVRGEISALLHGVSEGEGFLDALQRFIHSFQKTYGITAEVDDLPDQGAVSFRPSVEVQLLRIAQEAFTNIRKHSQASQVRVRLVAEPGCARFVIEDNGIGFESGLLPVGSQRYGLGIMSERAREFGGQVDIESAPGQGTRIIVTIPGNGAVQME